MDYCEFVSETICDYNADVFELAKEALVDEYLSFSIIPDEEITIGILSEKVCDYFEKLELKCFMGFEKQIDAYMKAVDTIVSRRVAQTPRQKKKSAEPAMTPRARKYYEKAVSIKEKRTWKVRSLLDYSRIMFCLYSAIIENDYRQIQNLNLSVDCIHPIQIIESMKRERDPYAIMPGKKPLFNIKELYSQDTSTFIITIIMLYAIINEKNAGRIQL